MGSLRNTRTKAEKTKKIEFHIFGQEMKLNLDNDVNTVVEITAVDPNDIKVNLTNRTDSQESEVRKKHREELKNELGNFDNEITRQPSKPSETSKIDIGEQSTKETNTIDQGYSCLKKIMKHVGRKEAHRTQRNKDILFDNIFENVGKTGRQTKQQKPDYFDTDLSMIVNESFSDDFGNRFLNDAMKRFGNAAPELTSAPNDSFDCNHLAYRDDTTFDIYQLETARIADGRLNKDVEQERQITSPGASKNTAMNSLTNTEHERSVSNREKEHINANKPDGCYQKNNVNEIHPEVSTTLSSLQFSIDKPSPDRQPQNHVQRPVHQIKDDSSSNQQSGCQYSSNGHVNVSIKQLRRHDQTLEQRCEDISHLDEDMGCNSPSEDHGEDNSSLYQHGEDNLKHETISDQGVSHRWPSEQHVRQGSASDQDWRHWSPRNMHREDYPPSDEQKKYDSPDQFVRHDFPADQHARCPTTSHKYESPRDQHGRYVWPQDQHGRHWSPSDQHGRHWSPSNKQGRRWSPSDQHGRHWSPSDQHGRHLSPLDMHWEDYPSSDDQVGFDLPSDQIVRQDPPSDQHAGFLSPSDHQRGDEFVNDGEPIEPMVRHASPSQQQMISGIVSDQLKGYSQSTEKKAARCSYFPDSCSCSISSLTDFSSDSSDYIKQVLLLFPLSVQG